MLICKYDTVENTQEWSARHICTAKTINIEYLLTYLLTPWCRVLLEKLTGLQLVKKFPSFHGTRRFITVLTSVHHLSLSWANPIQSTYPHPTSWRSILILSTHLRLGLPSGFFPSGFPTKTLYTPLFSPIRATCPAHLILLSFEKCSVTEFKCVVPPNRKSQSPAGVLSHFKFYSLQSITVARHLSYSKFTPHTVR